MKKIRNGIIILLGIALSIGLCACESESERAQREIDEAIERAEDVKRKIEDLERQQEIIQWAIDNAE